MRVVLEECWSEDAVRRVRAGEIDLGVIVEGADMVAWSAAPTATTNWPRWCVTTMRSPASSVAFADLLERDLVGLEGSSTLTRLLTAHAAQLLRPMALRVQVKSFEAVCRAVEARLGIGVLPLAAARSFAAAMSLRVLR